MERPESSKAMKMLPALPPTPTSPDTLFPKTSRTLPAGFVDAIKQSAPQDSITNYDVVHAWWWIVYEDMLEEMKRKGEESGWREVDSFVKR